MRKGKVVAFKKPGDISKNPLTEFLRTGAQQLIAQAVEAELHAFVQQFVAASACGKPSMSREKGMEEQGMSGNYSLVQADAEMLITHGVEPKTKAPSCVECHNNLGTTPDGSGIVPFTSLGYHTVPKAVKSCILCHEQKSLSWTATHQQHRGEVSCSSCHTKEPTGLVKEKSILCSSCHGLKTWKGMESHKKHIDKQVNCATCHTFS